MWWVSEPVSSLASMPDCSLAVWRSVKPDDRPPLPWLPQPSRRPLSVSQQLGASGPTSTVLSLLAPPGLQRGKEEPSILSDRLGPEGTLGAHSHPEPHPVLSRHRPSVLSEDQVSNELIPGPPGKPGEGGLQTELQPWREGRLWQQEEQQQNLGGFGVGWVQWGPE